MLRNVIWTPSSTRLRRIRRRHHPRVPAVRSVGLPPWHARRPDPRRDNCPVFRFIHRALGLVPCGAAGVRSATVGRDRSHRVFPFQEIVSSESDKSVRSRSALRGPDRDIPTAPMECPDHSDLRFTGPPRSVRTVVFGRDRIVLTPAGIGEPPGILRLHMRPGGRHQPLNSR